MADTLLVFLLSARCRLIVAALLASILALVSLSRSHYTWPVGYEWFVFASPVVSFFVAVLAMLQSIKRVHETQEEQETGIVLLNSLVSLFAFGTCLLLSTFSQDADGQKAAWWSHLLWLAVLFVLYSAWDMWMLRIVRDPHLRHDIRSGHLLVNRATIYAFLVLVGFIACQKDVTFQDILTGVREEIGRVTKAMGEEPASAIAHAIDNAFEDAKPPPQYREQKEVFVIGITSFHLLMSAFAYAGTAVGITRSRALNFFYHLLSWMPKSTFEYPKATGLGTKIDLGDICYWDEAAKEATAAECGGKRLGTCAQEAGDDAKVVRVELER